MRLVVMLIIVTLQFPFARAQEQSDALVVRKHPDNDKRFLCELRQANFMLPDGWKPHLTSSKSTCVLTWGDDKEVTIQIQYGIAKASNSKEFADAWAKTWEGGEVLRDSMKLDGEAAYRIVIPPDGAHKPVEAILVMKQKRGFMIMGGAKAESDRISEALAEIAKTWKWKPE